MLTHTKLAVIGAGPGGYTAAFHAADLGLSVTLIDKNPNPGGTCLSTGCIPSKALLHAASILTEADDAKAIGICFGSSSINIEKLRSWKDSIINKLTRGLDQLSNARAITYIQGEARLTGSKSLEIKKADGSTALLTFEKAILATGSRPIELSSLPRSSRIWNSTDALALPSIPETLLVIGGGYIGLELGSAYAAFGSKVSIVESMPRLLGNADSDLAEIVTRRLKRSFTKIMTGTKVIRAEETTSGITVTFENANGLESRMTYSQILTSVGRKPNTDNIGIEHTRIALNTENFIKVNSRRQTTDENIYAIGDITGQPMLAHKASAEAKTVAQIIAGQTTFFDPKAIPSVVFTNPELAWAGLTETEARQKELDISVFKFPWGASGRALTLNKPDGLTKIIADMHTRRILGIGIAGVGAGDLISEGTLAIELGVTAKTLTNTIHPHPTLSETMMEAAEGLFGNCTHILKRYP